MRIAFTTARFGRYFVRHNSNLKPQFVSSSGLTHAQQPTWYFRSAGLIPLPSRQSYVILASTRKGAFWSDQPWNFALLAVPAFATCEALGPSTKEAGQPNLSGIWIRDDKATDLKAYEKQLEVMQITGVKKKTALNFIEGLQLTEKEDSVTIQFLTAVPFFKVTEEVKFDQEIDQPRRDKRSGVQKATTYRTKDGMTVEMRWDEPLAGSLVEQYKFDANTLIVESRVTVQGQSASARLVYRRNDKWRAKLSL